MTVTERWILAGSLLVGGVLVGIVLGWLVRHRLSRSRGGPTSSVAGAAGLLVFWSLTLVSTLFAIAMVRPETLEDVPRRLLEYTPRLISAGLILLVGYAVAIAAARVVGFGMEHASGRSGPRVAGVVRWAIIAATVILSLAQLGVDTTILVLLVGLGGLGVVLGGALLVGLGGRSLASEIAAGRYLGRHLVVGTEISSGVESGRVMALHPATIEIQAGEDGSRHIRYSLLLEQGVTVLRPPPGEDS